MRCNAFDATRHATPYVRWARSIRANRCSCENMLIVCHVYLLYFCVTEWANETVDRASGSMNDRAKRTTLLATKAFFVSLSQRSHAECRIRHRHHWTNIFAHEMFVCVCVPFVLCGVHQIPTQTFFSLEPALLKCHAMLCLSRRGFSLFSIAFRVGAPFFGAVAIVVAGHLNIVRVVCHPFRYI